MLRPCVWLITHNCCPRANSIIIYEPLPPKFALLYRYDSLRLHRVVYAFVLIRIRFDGEKVLRVTVLLLKAGARRVEVG